MIEFRAEVLPERGSMARAPPRRESKAQHVQHAQNRSHAHEDSENQADPDEQFYKANQIAEEDDMWQYDVAENGPIEADRCLLNIAFEIVCESGMSERPSEDLIFAEKNKEDSRTDSGDNQRFGKRAAVL